MALIAGPKSSTSAIRGDHPPVADLSSPTRILNLHTEHLRPAGSFFETFERQAASETLHASCRHAGRDGVSAFRVCSSEAACPLPANFCR